MKTNNEMIEGERDELKKFFYSFSIISLFFF